MSKSLANRLFLKDLYSLKVEEDSSPLDHINSFNGLITHLASLDGTFKDENKAIMLLRSLPDIPKYNTVVTSLLVGKKTLSLDETVACLLEVEKLSKQSAGSTSSGVGGAMVAARGRTVIKVNTTPKSYASIVKNWDMFKLCAQK